MEALQFEDTLTVASALTPSEQTVNIPTLSMHIDWNDGNNIDPGSNKELDVRYISRIQLSEFLG